MKKTDIYGTIGPSCGKQEILTEMFRLGMDGMRLNLSHAELSECQNWTEMIKNAAKAAGKQPKLLIDLRGPELRIGDLKKPLLLTEGMLVNLGNNPAEIPLPEMLMSGDFFRNEQECIFSLLKPEQEILLDDGKIQLTLTEICEGHIVCKVLRGGLLQSRKSIAFPGIVLRLPALTESDKRNIALAKSHGVTGVMLPFVRDPEDLKELKQELKNADVSEIKVFAKIENMDGVRNLKNLLPWADEIVIARGDLGNSMPLWELPAVQAQIAGICRQAQKPFLVVTQMLASMEEREVPTRAELSDIFRAVAEGASSVMVTGETAAGRYPVEVIRYLSNTVKSAEQYMKDRS